MIVVLAVVLYAATGAVIAAAFLAFGVDAGRAHPALSRRSRAVALRPGPLAEIVPMTRSQRSVHRALWPVLAVAVALGFAMALALRPPPDTGAPQAAQELNP